MFGIGAASPPWDERQASPEAPRVPARLLRAPGQGRALSPAPRSRGAPSPRPGGSAPPGVVLRWTKCRGAVPQSLPAVFLRPIRPFPARSWAARARLPRASPACGSTVLAARSARRRPTVRPECWPLKELNLCIICRGGSAPSKL